MGAAVIRAYGLDERIDARVKRAIPTGSRRSASRTCGPRSCSRCRRSSGGSPTSIVILVGATYGPGWGLTFGRGLGVPVPREPVPAPVQRPARDLLRDADRDRGVAQDPRAARAAGRGPRARSRGSTSRRGRSRSARSTSRTATATGPAVLARRLARRRRRRAHRRRRRDGVGQDDLLQAAVAARRPASRAGSRRRASAAPRSTDLASAGDPDGAAGRVPVRRHGARERPGRPPGASDREVEAAFEELGLGGWVESLPEGLATRVGERGESLSVGERQLVSLVRAQIARPGAADPGRGDERRRSGDRAADLRSAPAAVGRADLDHDRAPPVDRRACGRDRRVRRGPDRRAGRRTRTSSRAAASTRGCTESWLGNVRAG